ncbi:D-aminoacyl-tRNA deacylase [Solimicrobium silvestre]|uniref:D-aminoacyl-tRNA deacylase n=1 Tax=Solimicrobium silvestre TaxID=2099400 RepID=A0A2S9GV38_9BURK|nr:D-aminoacyl-tRNA deacylase [Solimicrobium silvestre]PRC91568.1 D-tyrosyl-tRNA(Tyr) deacylase [Solimicrobium silvestre]
MIALIQRVSHAQVAVAGNVIGQIEQGLLVLLCAERDDSAKEAQALCEKLLKYRVFSDAQGKMNLSVRDIAGGILLVPQFTLAADTNSGTRPSFTPAAAPALAQELFNHFVALTKAQYPHDGKVATGQFGADMQVSLCNDGPVTFWLECKVVKKTLEEQTHD